MNWYIIKHIDKEEYSKGGTVPKWSRIPKVWDDRNLKNHLWLVAGGKWEVENNKKDLDLLSYENAVILIIDSQAEYQDLEYPILFFQIKDSISVRQFFIQHLLEAKT